VGLAEDRLERIFRSVGAGRGAESPQVNLCPHPTAHVANATVKLPGYGDVKLPSISKIGSFYLVEEADHTVQMLIAGGPDELQLTTDKRWAQPDEQVTLTAAIALAPDKTFTGFTFTYGDGATMQQTRLAQVTHRFAKADDYLVTVTGKYTDGSSFMDLVAVFVRENPADSFFIIS